MSIDGAVPVGRVAVARRRRGIRSKISALEAGSLFRVFSGAEDGWERSEAVAYG